VIRNKVYYLKKLLKLRCDTRFQHAFTACRCVFRVFTLFWANQRNYFENATACSKRTLKTTVATQLKISFDDTYRNTAFVFKSIGKLFGIILMKFHELRCLVNLSKFCEEGWNKKKTWHLEFKSEQKLYYHWNSYQAWAQSYKTFRHLFRRLTLLPWLS